MSEGLGVALLALVVVALLGAMWVGWRRRSARAIAALPALPAVPALGAPRLGPVPVTYVATAVVGRTLGRVAAHGLAVRAPGEAEVHDAGLLLRRAGAADLFVPAADLEAVGPARALAGTAVGVDRLVVVRWRCGTMTLDTGVLPRHAADRAALTEAVRALVPTPTDGSPA